MFGFGDEYKSSTGIAPGFLRWWGSFGGHCSSRQSHQGAEAHVLRTGQTRFPSDRHSSLVRAAYITCQLTITMVHLPAAAISVEGRPVVPQWVEEASLHTMAGKGHCWARPRWCECRGAMRGGALYQGTCAPTYVQDKYGRLLDTDFYLTSTLNSSPMNTKSP